MGGDWQTDAARQGGSGPPGMRRAMARFRYPASLIMRRHTLDIVALCASLLVLAALASTSSMAEPTRVAHARARKLPGLKAAFADKGVPWPAKEILVRAFKRDGVLELWAGDGKSSLTMIKSWPVCATSGELGPKRRRGDLQVPEGVYRLDKLNPVSSYHLSMHVDYPNRADRAAGKRDGIGNLGGDIMVHGECVTIGCIPIENDPIEELYLAVLDSGLRPPIHIFPARVDEAGLATLLGSADDPAVRELWGDLAQVQWAFDRARRVPRVEIDGAGRYVVK